MSREARSPVADYRARLARRGFVRVEVTVSKDDARLVRHVAAALSDPTRQAAARVLLRQHFAEPPKVSLKALLAAAPLDGINMGRGRDAGRDIDLSSYNDLQSLIQIVAVQPGTRRSAAPPSRTDAHFLTPGSSSGGL